MTKDFVNSAEDTRTVNNVMRHEYRVLSESEKELMKTIKDMGLEFHQTIKSSLPQTRETEQALVKIEEAVMWAIKEITK